MQIVATIRERLPSVKIVVRADTGFSREEIIAWCEAQSDVFYLIGMARNPRLERLAGPATLRAAAQRTGTLPRVMKSWVRTEMEAAANWLETACGLRQGLCHRPPHQTDGTGRPAGRTFLGVPYFQ